MKKKKIIITSVVIALICGAWYGYGEYNRKVKDLETVKADMEINVPELISAFESNESMANQKYLDKIIAVKGTVRTVEINEKGYYSVILGQANSMSSVRCSMDSLHQAEVAGLKGGNIVIIKGACTGFNADELLGSDVILNRCVLNK